jgi:predicted Zn finger-like uncharacterized protein
MIVICEECGKKYRIDPAKIKGKQAKFRCEACNHILTVSKPEVKPPQPTRAPIIETDKKVAPKKLRPTQTAKKVKSSKSRPRFDFSLNFKRLSLRTKMLILFFVLPIVLFAVAGLLFLRQMNTLTSLLTTESTKIVSQMAEEKIAAISRSVATQCQLYLLSHPSLRKENFANDKYFKRLAVQKVGIKGYTALYQRPGSDGIWRTWAHVNPKIIGVDMKTLRKPLGRNFRGFWRVFSGVKKGKESKGYYRWQDKDGTFRDKFMVCTPIEGTPYVVAATTYIAEFTKPMMMLGARSEYQVIESRNTVWGIFGSILLLIGIIVSFYGYRLTGRIKSLTEVADRISVGELDAEIKTKSDDEIGDLAEAISRMQESVRLSIERLRRRR